MQSILKDFSEFSDLVINCEKSFIIFSEGVLEKKSHNDILGFPYKQFSINLLNVGYGEVDKAHRLSTTSNGPTITVYKMEYVNMKLYIVCGSGTIRAMGTYEQI